MSVSISGRCTSTVMQNHSYRKRLTLFRLILVGLRDWNVLDSERLSVWEVWIMKEGWTFVMCFEFDVIQDRRTACVQVSHELWVTCFHACSVCMEGFWWCEWELRLCDPVLSDCGPGLHPRTIPHYSNFMYYIVYYLAVVHDPCWVTLSKRWTCLQP